MQKLFPSTLLKFEHWFRSEDACRAYLMRLRWPEGFKCPSCVNRVAWKTRKGVLRCSGCRKDISVTAGTIFQDSHIPLRLWFRAMWLLTNQKTGISALGLQRALGLGSYRTAWSCLHRLRRAMIRPGREALEGEVEVDEAFVGGVEKGGGRRRIGKKALIVIALEARETGWGRIRLQRVVDSSEPSLIGFIQKTIMPGSKVITDGHWPYRQLPAYGYRHEPRVIGRGQRERASAELPGVHRVAALLKRWLLGVHQGRVERNGIDRYLEEFAFRFNRRNSPTRGMLFYRLAQQSMLVRSNAQRV